MKILKKIFTNAYVIAGIIIFLILFGIGLYLEFSVGESLFASAALAAVGTILIWWEREWFG